MRFEDAILDPYIMVIHTESRSDAINRILDFRGSHHEYDVYLMPTGLQSVGVIDVAKHTGLVSESEYQTAPNILATAMTALDRQSDVLDKTHRKWLLVYGVSDDVSIAYVSELLASCQSLGNRYQRIHFKILIDKETFERALRFQDSCKLRQRAVDGRNLID